MLRAKDRSPAPARRPARAAAVLFGVVLLVSGLRLPAQGPARPDAAPPAGLNLFDPAYLPPDADGLFTFRPAALMARPEMKKQRDELNAMLEPGFKELGIKAGCGLKVEDIDLMVSPAFIRSQKTDKGPQTNLQVGLCLVRTVRDFDWHRWVKERLPNGAEIKAGGKVFLKAGMDFPHAPGQCFHALDARTLLVLPEKLMRKALAGEKAAAPAWLADFRQVEGSVLGLAVAGGRPKWLAERRQPELDMPKELVALLTDSAALTLGVTCEGDRVALRGLLRSANAEGRRKAARAWRDLLAAVAKALAELPAMGKERKTELSDLLTAVVRQAAVEEQGETARWHAEVRADARDLWDCLQFNAEKR